MLRNNYLQTLSLSLTERRGLEDLGFLQRLMQVLEAKGELDRAVEFLPEGMEIAERRKRMQSLTRPELAVLLAYAKLSLKSELLDSDVPDDPYLGRELARYFPQAMSARFPDALQKHRLRREIIATQLANSMINRGGPALVVRIADETGASAAGIAAAFAAVRDSYDMPALNEEINALDGKVAGDVQLGLYAQVQNLLLDRLVWFLRNADLSKGLGWAGRALSRRHCRSRRRARFRLAGGGRRCPRGMGGGTRHSRRAGRTGAALRHSPAADDRARYRAGGGSHQDAGGRSHGDLFRGRGFLPPRPHHDSGAARSGRRIISIGSRSIVRSIPSATPSAASPRRWWRPARQAKPRWKPGSSRSATEIDRIRTAVHEIAASGLTISKLSVAASLLGDLVKN